MKEQRIQSITNYIHSQGTVSLDDLCEKFGVSKNTIRRDVNKIIQTGEVQKVYGGVMSLSNELLPFDNRSSENYQQKEAIAKRAAAFIENNDLVFIDSGTTTCSIPKYIDSNKKITIITNSLSVVNESVAKENFDIILIGNKLKRQTQSFVNVDDWLSFDRMNINKAFLAATGLSVDKGITNSDILEYEIKHRVVQKASQNILLVDHTKFNKAALLTYCSFNDLTTIVSDRPVPVEYDATLREANVNVILAN